jgi:hypothetical protein
LIADWTLTSTEFLSHYEMSEFDNLPNLYIGFDLSTQQLKLTVIDDTYQVVFEETVHFDKELPNYGYII